MIGDSVVTGPAVAVSYYNCSPLRKLFAISREI